MTKCHILQHLCFMGRTESAGVIYIIAIFIVLQGIVSEAGATYTVIRR